MSTLDIPFMSSKVGLSRRNFIGLMLVSGIAGFSPKSIFAADSWSAAEQKSLSLYNPHTKDSFNGVYWSAGEYDRDALKKINHIMRDFRINDVKQIDRSLLDLLSEISLKLKSDKPIHVISGYRSPETNAKLRKRGKAAAKNSYHIQGKAVDIRMPGCRTSVLRRAAFRLKGGGVGYYPHQRFVHIDVGPIRYWKGA